MRKLAVPIDVEVHQLGEELARRSGIPLSVMVEQYIRQAYLARESVSNQIKTSQRLLDLVKNVKKREPSYSDEYLKEEYYMYLANKGNPNFDR